MSAAFVTTIFWLGVLAYVSHEYEIKLRELRERYDRACEAYDDLKG